MKNLLTLLLMTIATYGCSNEKDSILIPINSENTESNFTIKEPDSYTLALAFSCDCEGNPEKLDKFSRDITGFIRDKERGIGSIQTSVTITIKNSKNEFTRKTYIENGSSGSIYTKLEEQGLKVSLRVLNGLPNLKNGDYSIKIENLSPTDIFEKYRTFILISHINPKV